MFIKIFVKIVSVMLSVIMTLSTPLGLIEGKKEAKIAHAKDNCRVSIGAFNGEKQAERLISAVRKIILRHN